MDEQYTSEIRDSMPVDRDAPIRMAEGTVLRAFGYRPAAERRYPVFMTQRGEQPSVLLPFVPRTQASAGAPHRGPFPVEARS